MILENDKYLKNEPNPTQIFVRNIIFQNFLTFCRIFILHLKDHGIFILMADEKINKGGHLPQKIMKKF